MEKEVRQVLFGHNGATWTAVEQESLRSESLRIKTVVQRAFAPGCSSGLFTSKFHLLNHVAKVSERCVSMLVTDAASFEDSDMLRKQSYRIPSRRYLTRMYETVHVLSRALKSVQREESQILGGVFGAELLRK